MDNKLRFSLCLFSVIFLFSASFISISCRQKDQSASLTDAYRYPVTPGTEEWLHLSSHEQLLETCQIPESELETMSTAGLLETVLNYPLSSDYLAYSSTQQGFEKVYRQFNALSELMDRPDVTDELQIKYSSMDPAALDKKWSNLRRSEFFFSFLNIERILSQHQILVKLDEAQLSELIREALVKVDIKKQNPDFYGWLGMEYSAWLIGKSLEQLSYQPLMENLGTQPSLRYFLVNGSSSDESLRDNVISLGQQFISES